MVTVVEVPRAAVSLGPDCGLEASGAPHDMQLFQVGSTAQPHLGQAGIGSSFRERAAIAAANQASLLRRAARCIRGRPHEHATDLLVNSRRLGINSRPGK
jgi:hypothetical protein